MAANVSWNAVQERVNEYYAWLLALGAGMLGVFLALILIAVLRNGMQLANVGGAAQDIVVGGLLLGAILAGMHGSREGENYEGNAPSGGGARD